MAANDACTATDARVARYWDDFFGCTPEELVMPGTRVLSHAGLADYQGVYLFRRGASCSE